MELLTELEALEKLKISRQTIYSWRKQGKLPFVSFGTKAVRYRVSDIEKLIKDHLIGTQMIKLKYETEYEHTV